MNQFLSAAAAFTLALVLWGIGKKPKAVFTTTGNEPYLLPFKALVHKEKDAAFNQLSKDQITFSCWSPPQNPAQIHALRIKLHKMIGSGPQERLEAVAIASQWGHSSVIPILRRGLKDFDSEIVVASAKAIEKFRSSLYLRKLKSSQVSLRAPSNISLIR